MKFSAAFTVALLSLAKFIAADSESFGLVSLRSGSSSSSSSAAPASSSAAPASSSEAAKTSAAPVSQIGDGQIQATTATPKPTAQAVSQIGDGQIQATTGTQSVLVKTDVGNNAGKVTLGSSAAVAALAALLL